MADVSQQALAGDSCAHAISRQHIRERRWSACTCVALALPAKRVGAIAGVCSLAAEATHAQVLRPPLAQRDSHRRSAAIAITDRHLKAEQRQVPRTGRASRPSAAPCFLDRSDSPRPQQDNKKDIIDIAIAMIIFFWVKFGVLCKMHTSRRFKERDDGSELETAAHRDDPDPLYLNRVNHWKADW